MSSFKSFKTLVSVSFKMYLRNGTAVFFTLLFPFILLMVFGFLSGGSGNTLKIDVTNHTPSKLAERLIEDLKEVEAFEIKETTEKEAAEALGKGDIDLQLIIPENFGYKDPVSGQALPTALISHYNEAKPQNGQMAVMIIGQVVNGLNQELTHVQPIIQIQSSGVTTNNLGFFDFMLPGVLSMTIMQLGIFGVAFAFVSLKASGSLRRLQATPIHPRNFIMAQAFTRLIIALVSIVILLAFGVWFFDFHMIGSYWEFMILAILGTIVFLGLGFGIAGWAKDENQVAPVANLIQLPMLFLGGIFFSRDNFPGWLHTITDYFPLTFLGDGLRKIANEGAHLTQLGGEVLGLVIWGIIIFVIAVNVFRWE